MFPDCTLHKVNKHRRYNYKTKQTKKTQKNPKETKPKKTSKLPKNRYISDPPASVDFFFTNREAPCSRGLSLEWR